MGRVALTSSAFVDKMFLYALEWATILPYPKQGLHLRTAARNSCADLVCET